MCQVTSAGRDGEISPATPVPALISGVPDLDLAAVRTCRGGALARIVVADNSAFYRQILVDAFVAQGHEVTVAGDGLEAVQEVVGRLPDAVILDLVMPRLGGAAACRRLKADPRTSHIPVIILSGLREDEIDDRDLIGADAYVAKMQPRPMVEHLRAALAELLQGGIRTRLRGFDEMHRREVVSELLEERRSREEILDGLAEGVLRVAPDGRIVQANSAACELLGQPRTDLLNRLATEALGCPTETMQRLLSAPEGAPAEEARLGLAGRTLLARTRQSPATGRDLLLYLTDVSSETRAENEIRVLSERIQASERLKGLGEIAAGAALELDGPLTGVLGYADLLLQVSGDERTRERVDKLRAQAQRCKRIVDNLLCFARRRQAYRRAQDINAVVMKALSGQEAAATKASVAVRRDLGVGLPAALYDFPQMEQVLVNLLSNAIQACAAGQGSDRTVTVRTALAPGGVAIEIQDNGPGLPAAVRGRLFEPFVTTRRPEGGAGLGLAVCYGIVEEHGGSITAADTRPGTRMRVELPLAPSLPHGAGERERDRSRPRVLVVDDEPVVLDLVDDVLSDRGFDVRRAQNGAQALERLQSSGFDAILIDLKMPDMSGRDLFEVIRDRHPEAAARVAFTTGDPDTVGLQRFLEASGLALLRKPFRLDEVAAVCRGLASGSDATRSD